jgi:uncharacterized protein (DUF952 family)
MPVPPRLVHICSLQDWESASSVGELVPSSLQDVGFVHLSAVEQVHLPANRLYSGRTDLVLLYLNPNLLDSPLWWEPGVPEDPASMLFPHLYGPLPVRAVTNVTPYLPGSEGSFEPIGR